MRNKCRDCGNNVPDTCLICECCSRLRNIDNEELIYKKDGDKICCHDENFINLQESIAGFGDSNKEAKEDFMKNLYMARTENY